MKGMRPLLFASVLLSLTAELSAARLPLDKAGYRKTVWIHANPWFHFGKPPIHGRGGPDIPWKQMDYGTNTWTEAFRLIHSYGIDGVQMEINEPSSWEACWKAALKAAEAVPGDFKLGMFFGAYSKTPEKSLENMKRILGTFREDLKSNPHVARAGGSPVIVFYNPHQFRPEGWKVLFDGLDAEFGRMAYLINAPVLFALSGYGEQEFERRLRELLPEFDGVSSYGVINVEDQRKTATVLDRVMKDFPGKIYEGGAFATYTQHFTMWGHEVRLSRDWRDSVDLWLGSKADDINLTNLFDHYENSLVYPCYEREDLLLRYLQWALSKWRGSEFPKEKKPELVLCNYNTVLLGWTPFDVEVLGFPIDSADKTVRISVELCDASGKVLKTLGPKTMTLDTFRAEEFSLPSMDFADERGVVPRLVYEWGGKRHVMNGAMTIVSPSIRTYRMYWARSTKNLLDMEGVTDDWSIDGVKPGGTVGSVRGPSVFFTEAKPDRSSEGPNKGYWRHGFKRDGLEWYFTSDSYTAQRRTVLALQRPHIGPGLHWYYAEWQNELGHKAQSLPIWETNGARARKVKMPIRQPDGTIVEASIEGARVPFYQYPCDRDTDRILVDVSGYMHNGHIDGTGFGYGHLTYTGYNQYHNGPVQTDRGGHSLFRTDADGTGFLHLAGTNHVVIHGGTAMPGAATYEICVRPTRFGREMGLFGSARGQVHLVILPDGTVRAKRRVFEPDMGKPETVEVDSKKPLPAGAWTRLQVVYDLRNLMLYVNGELQGSVAASPNYEDGSYGHYLTREWRTHEYETVLMVGADLDWTPCHYAPKRQFEGDIRDIRVYGRNLSPAEFLGAYTGKAGR